MRKLAAFALLALVACQRPFEEHDETLDPDKDGAIYTLDCEGMNEAVYYHLWYLDADGDGHGDPSTLVDSCAAPDDGNAWVRLGDDCNDNDGNAAAVRDGYLDRDSDGFGDGEALSVCDAVTPLADAVGDCDDADADVYPGAEALCGNAKDDDCDALPDCDGLDGDVEIATRGLRVEGVSAEGLGAALVSVGDINGDGDADLVFGAPGDDGVVYALLGPLGGEGEARALATARLLGEDRAGAGSALSALGDVDGDGYDDFLVGAPEAGDGGGAYLVPGPIRAVSDAGDDAALDLGRDVVKLATDELAVALGAALLGPGDVLDGDGVADLVMGAPDAGAGAGAVWIAAGPLGEDLIVEDDAVQVEGNAYGALGTSMATLGDIDGDGVNELALGAPGYGEGSMGTPWRAPDPLGAVYVVSQVEDARVADIAAADIFGEEVYTGFASVLGDAGDVDGDGYGDLLVSAPDADYSAGTVWLFSGSVLSEGGQISLESATAVIEGATRRGGLGSSLTSAGDLNVDGAGDVLIGASRTQLGDTPEAGTVTLWFGPLSGTLSSAGADAQILGDSLVPGQFGYATAVTPDGTIAIGAPMYEFEDDEASSARSLMGEGGRDGAGDLGWSFGGDAWGDGAVYVLHAGY